VQARLRSKDVFINCPFDDAYKPIFDAIVFAVYHLGFAARCALKVDDAGEARFAKITRIISLGNALTASTTSRPWDSAPGPICRVLTCRWN
jgi:hypothetical protein